MRDNTQHIMSICSQLARSGLQPTVALIKAKSAIPLPMPQIIHALKVWRSNPDAPQEECIATETSHKTQEQRLVELELRVAVLEKALSQLTKLTVTQE
ncbi:hypothetical protein [Bowmanella sp. JS7-9]|uniref:KfrA N-terminal DNA-binding domain-containing protein n=1 Tax=Pseudobowmanella zhangzhouensis TaxID=1537679 RepID=A0ABW1XLF0_9ALTE|nr:hypothetical protein [Bowmanella sp. JS7-9]